MTNINLGNINNKTGFTVTGANYKNGVSDGGLSGYSVSAAGDVNKDGYADVIIGAYGALNIAGQSYVIYGSANSSNIALGTLTNSQGFSINGTDVTDYSGWSVSGAGDVNGDGYADVIIGAPNYPGYVNTQNGISYVIYGSGNSTNIALAKLTKAQGFVMAGYNQGDYSGWSVSGAGDVNGDGYADVIIGAKGAYNYAGQSYVIYGGTNLNNIVLQPLTSTQGFAITGANAGDYSGWSVSGAGDVNGDGYADVIVGAYRALNSTGVSYVIYGSANPVSITLGSLIHSQGFTITGANANDQSGWSVSGAGDINGDGYADVIIGAPSPFSSSPAGKSYVVYGSANPVNIELASLSGAQGFIMTEADSVYAGLSVSGVGDVNKDGYADVIIGAYGALNFTGISSVIYGSANPKNISLSTLSNIQGFTLTGANAGDYSGIAVSGAGDVNGDGVVDVIVGAYGAVNKAGQSYVVFGNATHNSGTSSLSSSSTASNIGSSVSSAMTSSGSSGMATSSSNTVSFSSFSATSTNNNLINQVNFTITGAHANDYSGASVAVAGDVNGDGYADVIVGAIGVNNYAGQSYVVYGSANPANIVLSSLTNTQGFTITGAHALDYSGYSVSGAGDVNKDGYADFIVGAFTALNLAGLSYVIYGSANPKNISLSALSNTQGFIITGASVNDQSGYSVAGAGDVNKDGYADVIVGANGARNGAGLSYVIYGSANPKNISLSAFSNTQGFIITGANVNDQSGYSVAGAGDVNKDGYADVIVGANGARNGAGLSYVIYGSANPKNISLSALSNTQGFIITGANANDQSGYSVTGAGDVNKDGYADVVIGAYGASNNMGVSYVIYGSTNPKNISLSAFSNTQGFIITGANAGDQSGWSVSGVGDVNKDGYADIIVGAIGAHNYAGQSYVIYGSANSNNISLGTITKTQGFVINVLSAGDYSGSSVGGTGDVNGDGYADVIVGAYYALSHAGQSYIIFGGNSAQSISSSGLSSSSISASTSSTGMSFSSSTVFSSSYSSSTAMTSSTSTGALDASSSSSRSSTSPNLSVSSVTSIPTFNNTKNSSSSSTGSSVNSSSTSQSISMSSSSTGIMQFGGSSTASNPIYGQDGVFDLQKFTLSYGFKMTTNIFSPLAMNTVGDINNDGYDDIIIGLQSAAPLNRPYAGISYVVFGKSNGYHNLYLSALSMPDGFQIFGKAGLSGGAVSSAGDVNNDGYDDIIIGADQDTSSGSAYVILGKANGFANIDLAALSANAGYKIIGEGIGNLGSVVSSAGDVNKDGYSDIVVCSPQLTALSNAQSGVCYVIFGKNVYSNISLSNFAMPIGFRIFGENNSGLGTAISYGDINKDGYSDIVIGASGGPSVPFGAGQTYILFGKSSGFTDVTLANLAMPNGFKIVGGASLDLSGCSLSVGDVNKDGYDDVIIGASSASPLSRSQAGEGYIIYGKNGGFTNINLATLSSNQGFSIIGSNSYERSGTAVSYLKDVNGDGYGDFIIGAPDAIPGLRSPSGVSYLVFGQSSFTNIDFGTSVKTANVLRINGATGDYSGSPISSAADMNGDGYYDIIIGAPESPPNNTIYVIFGNSNLGVVTNPITSSSTGTNIANDAYHVEASLYITLGALVGGYIIDTLLI